MDPKQIYLTGVGVGGKDVWNIALQYFRTLRTTLRTKFMKTPKYTGGCYFQHWNELILPQGRSIVQKEKAMRKGLFVFIVLWMAAFPMNALANTLTIGGQMPGYAH